jgi:hypothetical protein
MPWLGQAKHTEGLGAWAARPSFFAPFECRAQKRSTQGFSSSQLAKIPGNIEACCEESLQKMVQYFFENTFVSPVYTVNYGVKRFFW